MAAPSGPIGAVSPDQLITIKVSVNEQLKKLKLPLRDLGMGVLPNKLRQVLDIKPEQHMILERYSDSAADYVVIADDDAHVFKTLIRAAKAKLKLRLKITVTPTYALDDQPAVAEATPQQEPPMPSARDSTALDRRSVGTGIFEFREARASRQTLVDDDDDAIPDLVEGDDFPRPDTTNTAAAKEPSTTRLSLRPASGNANSCNTGYAWSVYCNACDRDMVNAHYHCGICDGGDYDLCEPCVAAGVSCQGKDHWLIKRFIEDGKVITSTTTRVMQRSRSQDLAAPVEAKDVETETETKAVETENKDVETKGETKVEPAAAIAPLIESIKALNMPVSSTPPRGFTRTCNNCVVILPEHQFVTCQSCPDFDLCIPCHTSDNHGHHPAHVLAPSTSSTVLSLAARAKLAPGRNVSHDAICDGCDNKIYGIRHKCLSCPDWDYCNSCVQNARLTHPRHRFAPLYEPIPGPHAAEVRHFGVHCNGPLCAAKAKPSFITGVRYKCTICHDTDFCAACEALPENPHNHTHPLIKFKTHVREVSVSTEDADAHGNVRTLGDRPRARALNYGNGPAAAVATKSAVEVDAVKTVADFQPTEVKQYVSPWQPTEVKPCGSLCQPQGASKLDAALLAPPTVTSTALPHPSATLTAHFVRDSVADGQVYAPGTRFAQIWTLRNAGPFDWPAGCSVKFTGGDNMLNLDNDRPASAAALNDAIESNVIGRPVRPGEEVAFKVILKAPAREGNSISYWRVKAPDGTPFGHRLWCDIQVKKADGVASTAAESAEAMTLKLLAHQQALVKRMQASLMAKNADASSPKWHESPNHMARLQAMREMQASRREELLRQLQAQRESLRGLVNRADATVNAGPSTFVAAPAPAVPSMKTNDESFNLNSSPTSTAIKSQEHAALMMERQKQLMKARCDSLKTALSKSREQKVEKKEVEAATQEETLSTPAQADSSESLAGSQMVFPKLDRESPMSSTYESATSRSGTAKPAFVENEEGVVEDTAVEEPAEEHTSEDHHDTESTFSFSSPPRAHYMPNDAADDDLEILSAVNDDEDDEDDDSDGFVTDDEYDILDASDRETVV